MNLWTFGCSLMFGTDLQDDNRHGAWSKASRLTWPALLANRFDLEYQTKAKGGSGNLCILDRMMQAACLFPDSIFVVGWTYIDRFDYSRPGGRHFNGGQEDYLTLRPAENNELEKFYFANFQSEYKDKLTNLIYIKTAIDFLNAQKIPFLMTAIDDLLFCEKWHAPPSVIKLQQAIRPYISDFEGKNFIDWSRRRGFQISQTGHPLEEAHAAAADLMAPAIDAILRRA